MKLEKKYDIAYKEKDLGSRNIKEIKQIWLSKTQHLFTCLTKYCCILTVTITLWIPGDFSLVQ